jgi:hypothetical protein
LFLQERGNMSQQVIPLETLTRTQEPRSKTTKTASLPDRAETVR